MYLKIRYKWKIFYQELDQQAVKLTLSILLVNLAVILKVLSSLKLDGVVCYTSEIFI